MKKILLIVSAALLILSCEKEPKKETTSPLQQIQGAWDLQRRYVDNSKIIGMNETAVINFDSLPRFTALGVKYPNTILFRQDTMYVSGCFEMWLHFMVDTAEIRSIRGVVASMPYDCCDTGVSIVLDESRLKYLLQKDTLLFGGSTFINGWQRRCYYLKYVRRNQ